MIGIDLSEARRVHANRLRARRQPLLEALDVAFLQALEAGDEKQRSAVVARKEQLRAVTEAPDLLQAATLRQVRQSWPEALLGPSPYPPEAPFPSGADVEVWTDPDGFRWRCRQARGVDGRFRPDDASTEVDEAWQWQPGETESAKPSTLRAPDASPRERHD